GVRGAGHAGACVGGAVAERAAGVRAGLWAGAGGAGGPAVRPGVADRVRGRGRRVAHGEAEDRHAEVADRAAGAAQVRGVERRGMAKTRHGSEIEIEVAGEPYVWRLQRQPQWSSDTAGWRGMAIAVRHREGQREAVVEFPPGPQPRYGAAKLQASQIAPGLV